MPHAVLLNAVLRGATLVEDCKRCAPNFGLRMTAYAKPKIGFMTSNPPRYVFVDQLMSSLLGFPLLCLQLWPGVVATLSDQLYPTSNRGAVHSTAGLDHGWTWDRYMACTCSRLVLNNVQKPMQDIQAFIH